MKYKKIYDFSVRNYKHKKIKNPVMQDWTFFHVTRYNEGVRSRIFQSFDYDWYSGFNRDGLSGVCFHENLITPEIDYHGTDWIISTDSRSLYRYKSLDSYYFVG